jgi:nicotinate-nucleotide pyrophosphorylase (carboxylating)
MTFSDAEAAACLRLVQLAHQEDLSPHGDLTSEAIIPLDLTGQAVFVARGEGVIAGLAAAEMAMTVLKSPVLDFQTLVQDGTQVKPGTPLATVRGSMRSMLATERTALNFLLRLSGVSTMTRHYVDAVGGLKVHILDTRKTTPGWRLLEKYAVRCGGGHNHRLGLSDGFLIKDNHLAALASRGISIAEAVRLARQHSKTVAPVEIEVDNLLQLDEALACLPDIVLLDNMDLATLQEAVRRRDAVSPKVVLEASGGVTLATVRAIAETGVDCISVGALTHSAPALDIALDYKN